MIHRIEQRQILRGTLDECWAFFSNPGNLSLITPPDLDFQLKSDLPAEVYAGLMIEYRVRPLFRIALTWLTEITHVERYRLFVDEQRTGPFALWHHEHHFVQLPSGTVEMRDLIHYRLPFSPFSEIAHNLLVAPQLKRIFDFRTTAVERAIGVDLRPIGS